MVVVAVEVLAIVMVKVLAVTTVCHGDGARESGKNNDCRMVVMVE